MRALLFVGYSGWWTLARYQVLPEMKRPKPFQDGETAWEDAVRGWVYPEYVMKSFLQML
jgi:hypothetical protein